MIALQHRDGSFKEPSQLDILEHTAEISGAAEKGCCYITGSLITGQ